VAPVRQARARRRAIELYRTTNLSVRAISREVGVSRETVYRWLHQAGVPIGRNPVNPVNPVNPATGQTGSDPGRLDDDIAGIRRDLTTLMAQIARLERLVEAAVRVEAGLVVNTYG
jgi:transposase-like protein